MIRINILIPRSATFPRHRLSPFDFFTHLGQMPIYTGNMLYYIYTK